MLKRFVLKGVVFKGVVCGVGESAVMMFCYRRWYQGDGAWKMVCIREWVLWGSVLF